MAIELSKKTAFGIDASYWRIRSVNLNYNRNKTTIQMDGYSDRSLKTNTPLLHDAVILEGIFEGEDSRKECYLEIKKLDDYKNGKDV